jgi:hypothetical protein
MKAALGVLMLAIWVGAWACGDKEDRKETPCIPVQLTESDTAMLTTKADTVYLSTRSDTVHKPYGPCVRFLAADTVHKPT